MRKSSKILALLLVAAMFISAACTTGTDSGAAPQESGGGPVVLSPDNPVTIPIWFTSGQMAPAPDNKISALLKERLGVTLEYDITTPDLQDQRIGVMLAGGNLPDILGPTDINARMVNGGALLRLDDYLDSGDYPNLAAHVEPYRKKLSWTGGGVEDGLYIFPNYNRFYGDPPLLSGDYMGTGFFIQKAVLEHFGYPDLENMTLERYFGFIEDYMAEFPEIDGQQTIGFTFPAFDGREWGLTNPPNFLAGNPNNGGVIIADDGTATIYANSQYAYDYFKFLNEAYAKGLVDPESFTQTLDQYEAKIATGRVLGMHDQRWSFGNANDSLVQQGKDERTYVATMPVFEGKEPWYADFDVMNINQGLGISASAENPELLLTFLDTLLSEEWQIILSWGIEGEDYLVDENGMYYRTPEQRTNADSITWRQSNRLEALFDIMPKRQGTLSNGNALERQAQPIEFFGRLSEYDKNFLEQYGKQTWRDFVNDPPENPVYYPAWQIQLPDGSDAQVAQAQLDDAAIQYLPLAIMADPADFDAKWKDYTDAIDRIDVAALEAVFTAGVQERMATWGE
ncbi:MAG: extracellular solute-binding protein [Clostridiales bacterium]|jgi:putative aldouronate transport system substrate-binding protein|nr:extracellular solute-binding protein [Clostridiales bacterium]